MLNILYFVHDLADPAVRRRVLMLQAGGARVALAGFRRGDNRLADVGGVVPIVAFALLVTSNMAVRNSLPGLYGVLTGGRAKRRSVDGDAPRGASATKLAQQQR